MSKLNDSKALQEARKAAMARAAQETPVELPSDDIDLDEAECFVRLVIEMYASKLKLGMGVLPDGMAVFIRLAYPSTCENTHAGMVSFVISDDTLSVLRKAVQALEAPAKPPYWKPDQYAAQRT